MMELTRDEVLDKLLRSCETWYDIERTDGPAPLAATAFFHEHGEKYVISRKAQLWAADQYEYLWFYSVPVLTADIAKECIERTRTLGEERIAPHKDHMSSYAVAILLCDSAEPDAVSVVKRSHYRKSFQYSLQGWMELHSILINRDTGEVLSNSDGRQTAKSLKDALYPAPKERARLARILKELF